MRRANCYLVVILALTSIAGAVLFFAARPFGSTSSDAIFLPFDLRYNGAYKLHSLPSHRLDILWIGSSRAATFRSNAFQPYSFYNMSFTAWTTDQIADVFERATRDTKPRVVILSLDYFLFTDAWEQANAGSRTMIYGQTWTYLRSSIADFLQTALKHPRILQKALFEAGPFVGTQALLQEEGFRRDGSYQFSASHIDDARQRHQTAETLVQAIPGGTEMSERQMAAIGRIAEMAKQRGITLVGVQLPFIRAGIDYLDHNESYRDYAGVWREFESDRNRNRLETLGIRFFDLARSPINDDKANFVDSYHVSELGALRVIQRLLDLPGFRAIFPDIDPVRTEQHVREVTSESRPALRIGSP